jgi:hypothetical protein
VRARQTFGPQVAVVTISQEMPQVAGGYLRLWNLALPLVPDLSGNIFRTYSVSKIPVTLVVDPAGDVSYVSVGGLSWDELSGAIERAQASVPASTPGAGVLQ